MCICIYIYIYIYFQWCLGFVFRRGEHLLFSYHGIPRAVSWAAGDPYVCLCFQTTRLVAQQLGLKVHLLLLLLMLRLLRLLMVLLWPPLLLLWPLLL